MSALAKTTDRDQSRGEELANSISHGAGLVAALIGTPYLIAHALRHGDLAFVVGTSVFAATIIMLYLSSALYHGWPAGKVKRLMRVVEHSAISLLIAGTYTPFTLGVLRGPWGWWLLVAIWGLAAGGVALKIFASIRRPVLSTGIYLVMGWLIVVALRPLLENMPAAGIAWLLGGGLFYTAGVVFYVLDSRLHYGHLIWHLFVLAGTLCHYFAVLWYAG